MILNKEVFLPISELLICLDPDDRAYIVLVPVIDVPEEIQDRMPVVTDKKLRVLNRAVIVGLN